MRGTGNSNTEYEDTGVAHDTIYHYRIRAIYSNGTGGHSNTFQFRTPHDALPLKPHSVSLALSGNSLEVAWNVIRRNSYYGIERIVIGRRFEDENEVGTYPGVATIADLAVLRPETTASGKACLYRGRAVNIKGASGDTPCKSNEDP